MMQVVKENVVTDVKSGYVTSKCGTHLGTYLRMPAEPPNLALVPADLVPPE